jgi:tRNA threonylcarbamoyladenosine biosynthesis protein TsaE
MEKIENYVTNNEDETIQLGKTFAGELEPGDIVGFYGDLGAGKTEFIKGICDFFNIDDIVTSPTFTIMNQYNSSHKHHDIIIYHIDLYRIKSTKELEEIGFNDCLFDNTSIKLVEWAEKANGYSKHFDYIVRINFNNDSETERNIEIRNSKGAEVLFTHT